MSPLSAVHVGFPGALFKAGITLIHQGPQRPRSCFRPSSGEVAHESIQRRLAFEADAGSVGQREISTV